MEVFCYKRYYTYQLYIGPVYSFVVPLPLLLLVGIGIVIVILILILNIIIQIVGDCAGGDDTKPFFGGII